MLTRTLVSKDGARIQQTIMTNIDFYSSIAYGRAALLWSVHSFVYRLSVFYKSELNRLQSVTTASLKQLAYLVVCSLPTHQSLETNWMYESHLGEESTLHFGYSSRPSHLKLSSCYTTLASFTTQLLYFNALLYTRMYCNIMQQLTDCNIS